MSIDNTTIGCRLRSARRTLGLTQTEAGGQMDMVTSTVSAIEAGKRSVTGTELYEFAQLYGRPISYFLQTGEASTSPGFEYLFRRVDDTVIDRQPIVELEQLATDYDLLEELVGVPPPPLPPDYSSFGFIGEQGAEALAETERARLGLGDAPIRDLVDLLECDAGLRVFMLPLSQHSWSGLVVQDHRGRPCVAIDSTELHYRRNFTLAHEYGHALVHLPDPTAPKAWVDLASKDTRRRNSDERFVDAFAAAFLMPRRAVLSQLDRIANASNDGLTEYDLAHLAMHFGVSGQAMSLRLVTLRRLSTRAHRGCWARTSHKSIVEALGYEVEDEDWRAPVILPPRYRYLAMKAYEEGIISLSKLAELLRENFYDLRDRLQYLDD